jgi:hypothetical protein
MRHCFARVRPQIMVSILLLGGIAFFAIDKGIESIGVGCIAGLIALAKDVLSVDSGAGPTQDE